MANIERKQESEALAFRTQQAEEIKKVVPLIIPEDGENKELFARNCMLFIVENDVMIEDGKVIIPNKSDEKKTITMPVVDFVGKMWRASKLGLNFGCREFALIPFGGEKKQTVQIVPDYRVERKRVEEKGITIRFLHGYDGDKVYMHPDPLKHRFECHEQEMVFSEIEGSGNNLKIENKVVWYACVARNNATGEELSYVESAKNILLRANPAWRGFYDNPNSVDSMYDKFVMRQLIKRLPSNWGGENWDKIEDIPFEEVAEEATKQIEEAPAPTPRPIEQEKRHLEKDSETWEKMEKAIKGGKVKDITAIERKYIIAESDRPEILAMLMENCTPAENEKSPMNLFNE